MVPVCVHIFCQCPVEENLVAFHRGVDRVIGAHGKLSKIDIGLAYSNIIEINAAVGGRPHGRLSYY